eukprot:CAMPEP_0119533888 /NCGR_PEP_ID=MMETSP1344-20130328/47209_1 /TAXON_ID=236787 /ORGANISM="Florenciella parvula, Strain CCMP2471" /LENGTH=45 /DNA_ID= /DNA_START= /DNA_END= /DNA_ORIENTATION=
MVLAESACPESAGDPLGDVDTVIVAPNEASLSEFLDGISSSSDSH